MRFFGYIDPGTGSFAIQAVLGAALGAGYVLRGKIRLIAAKIKGNKAEKPADSQS